VSDETDYTVPRHGRGRAGLPHVEIEIRQDLITDDGGPGRLGPAHLPRPAIRRTRFSRKKPHDSSDQAEDIPIEPKATAAVVRRRAEVQLHLGTGGEYAHLGAAEKETALWPISFQNLRGYPRCPTWYGCSRRAAVPASKVDLYPHRKA